MYDNNIILKSRNRFDGFIRTYMITLENMICQRSSWLKRPMTDFSAIYKTFYYLH